MINRLALYISCVIIASLCISPKYIAWAQKKTLHFQRFGIDQGLTGNSITSLLQDTTGFLWIGTSVGLNRYDGNTVKKYRSIKRDSSGLVDDFILSLFHDKTGTIWVGTRQGGLHRYNPFADKFEQFDLVELLKYSPVTAESTPNHIFDIEQSADGRLWLATLAGLVVFDIVQSNAVLVRTASINPTPVQALLIDDRRRLWYGDDAGRVIRMPSVANDSPFITTSESMLHLEAPITALAQGPDGSVWAATEGEGLYRYGQVSGLFEPYPITKSAQNESPSDSIKTMVVDAQNRIWIGYKTAGLALLYPDETYRHFRHDPNNSYSLSHDEVLKMFVDHSDNVWIGTWSGLNKLSPWYEAIDLYTSSTFTGYLPEKRIFAIREELQGILWLGTAGGGLIRTDLEQERFTQYTQSDTEGRLCDNSIHDLRIMRTGMMWLATHGDGLCAFHPNPVGYEMASMLNEGIPAILKGTDVLSLHETLDKRMLVGSREKGMGAIDLVTGNFVIHKTHTIPDSLPTNYIWPIVDGDGATVWIGAYGEGIVHFDLRTNRFTTHVLDEGSVSSNNVYDLIRASNGYLWLATDAGAVRFDPQDATTVIYTESNGLAFNNVRGIVEDDYGDIWFSTNNGLSRFSRATGTFKNFYAYDGLQSDRFYARAVEKLSDGRLAFGGDEGFNIIDPSMLKREVPTPQLVLSEVRVNGEPYKNPEGIPVHRMDRLILKPGENRFSLSFAVLDFTDVAQNRFRFELLRARSAASYISGMVPRDSEPDSWVERGTDPTIDFHSLAYGDYTLRVQGFNSERVGSEVFSLPITIETPLWATDWFRAVVLLALAGIVYGGIALRKQYLWGLDRMRLKLASSLHDDVGASLATIGMKIGLLQRRVQLSEEEKKQLALIGKLARETGHSVRDTEWIIKSEHDTLDQLVAQLHDQADSMLSGSVMYVFDCTPERVPPLKIDMDFRQNVLLLYKEALNNSNKYAKASRIDISIHIEQPMMYLSVKDDGIGFRQDQLSRTNGLSHMTMRANNIGGRLDIVSAPGNGTEITLLAPIQQNWLDKWRRSQPV